MTLTTAECGVLTGAHEGPSPASFCAAEVPKGNQKSTSHDQGKQDAANVPAATEDPYVEKLSKIDPVDLGTYWGAFQCEPRGPLWKIGNFQTERHLLNTYRPADAQVKLACHVARHC